MNGELDRFLGVFRFLNGSGITYLTIGAIPAGILGEPRYTADVDILIYLAEGDLDRFLRYAKTKGYRLNIKRQKGMAARYGGMRFAIDDIGIDCMIASTMFEFVILGRRSFVRWHGIRVPIPSPEDMILLKLYAGREKDIPDARNVLIRCRQCDVGYMRKWARWLSGGTEKRPVLARLGRLMRDIKRVHARQVP